MSKKLSKFVEYKSSVDNIEIDNTKLLTSIQNAIGIISNDDTIDTSLLKSQKKVVTDELDRLLELLGDTKDQIYNEVRKREREYLINSQKLYEIAKEYDKPEYIKERFDRHPISPNKEYEELLNIEISENSSWKHAGLLVRPANYNFIDSMVSLDPLYVVDEDYELLEDVKQKRSKIYQEKLRYNIINDDDNDIFKKIPTHQLGTVFVCDFFNYKSLDTIKKYCTQIMKLLKPGGILIFTYNNCDLPNAVRNFEHSLYTYVPGSLLKPMVEMLGYKIVKEFNDITTNTNWLTLKKPGELTSIKGGQALATLKTFSWDLQIENNQIPLPDKRIKSVDDIDLVIRNDVVDKNLYFIDGDTIKFNVGYAFGTIVRVQLK